jgi:hypothetical protein
VKEEIREMIELPFLLGVEEPDFSKIEDKHQIKKINNIFEEAYRNTFYRYLNVEFGIRIIQLESESGKYENNPDKKDRIEEIKTKYELLRDEFRKTCGRKKDGDRPLEPAKGESYYDLYMKFIDNLVPLIKESHFIDKEYYAFKENKSIDENDRDKRKEKNDFDDTTNKIREEQNKLIEKIKAVKKSIMELNDNKALNQYNDALNQYQTNAKSLLFAGVFNRCYIASGFNKELKKLYEKTSQIRDGHNEEKHKDQNHKGNKHKEEVDKGRC